jgi:hypothetical protein
MNITQDKPIIVFGIGPDVLSEIASVPFSEVGYDYMAVGMDAVPFATWPIQYVVTNHFEDIPQIHHRRRLMGGNLDFKLVSYKKHPNVDFSLEPLYEGPSGSSAIVGVLAALQMGYEKVILCGCPLTGKAFEGNPYEAFRAGWEYHKEKLLGKVVSMSGWTKTLLGAPTEDWLKKIKPEVEIARHTIPLRNILSDKGNPIFGSEVFRAYVDYANYDKQRGKDKLVELNVKSYFEEGSSHTEPYVNEVYKKRGLEKPEDKANVRRSFVTAAVEKRVDEYLTRFDKLIKEGYSECSFQIYVRPVNGNFQLTSCGFHKIAAMLALGYDEIPNIIVKDDRITVGACWDGGDYYSHEYINILYNSIKRHTSIPFDFVLYVGPLATESKLKLLNTGIQVHQTGLPYWWCGMPFWQKNPPLVKTETLLYMDLDQVIVGDLDEIINFPSNHAYMKDYPADLCPPGKENDGNATLSLIRNGAGSLAWDEYVKAGMPQWNPLSPPPNRLFPLAVQGLVNDLKIPHDVFPEDWVPSYRLQVLRRGLPKDCKSVSFHGRPKPHECNEPWVKENWR